MSRRIDTHYCIECKLDRPKALFTKHRIQRLKDKAKCTECEPTKPRSAPRKPEPNGVYSCGVCKETLPLDHFYINARGGVFSYCKVCDRKRQLDVYRAEHDGDATPKRKVLDMRYDYAFAKDILGWGPDKTLLWIGKGYRIEADSVAGHGFHKELGLRWQPDELKEDDDE